MGLDITSYSRLKAVPPHGNLYNGMWCQEEDGHGDHLHVQAYAYDCFPRSFRGLPILGTNFAGGSAFLYGGCYATTDETETHWFYAGSYSGYGAWRRDLARQFNPQTEEKEEGYPGTVPGEPDPGLPFYELIWFADNEGTIGPEAAADLLVDFREHAEAYAPDANAERDSARWQFFHTKYAEWTRACELAANGGLIVFH